MNKIYTPLLLLLASVPVNSLDLNNVSLVGNGGYSFFNVAVCLRDDFGWHNVGKKFLDIIKSPYRFMPDSQVQAPGSAFATSEHVKNILLIAHVFFMSLVIYHDRTKGLWHNIFRLVVYFISYAGSLHSGNYCATEHTHILSHSVMTGPVFYGFAVRAVVAATAAFAFGGKKNFKTKFKKIYGFDLKRDGLLLVFIMFNWIHAMVDDFSYVANSIFT